MIQTSAKLPTLNLFPPPKKTIFSRDTTSFGYHVK